MFSSGPSKLRPYLSMNQWIISLSIMQSIDLTESFTASDHTAGQKCVCYYYKAIVCLISGHDCTVYYFRFHLMNAESAPDDHRPSGQAVDCNRPHPSSPFIITRTPPVEDHRPVVTYLQFSIQVCFLSLSVCRDTQPATPTSVTDTLTVLIVV